MGKFDWGNFAGGAIGGVLGIATQGARARQQHNRQKELMGMQFENQKKLNADGSKRQLQMWKDTNYGAQLEQMKLAGLNPGLMYGMSGGGGQTTGSQSGGNAQSGSSHAPMDIGASVQAGLMMAQAAKLKAETKEIEAKTGKVGQDISESEQRIAESISKAELNAKLGVTEDSKVKLNESIKSLNDAKTKEAIKNTELNDADLKWMKENNINRNDSVVVKTLKHVAKVSGMSEQAVLKVIGGVLAARELGNMVGNIIPLGKILKKN